MVSLWRRKMLMGVAPHCTSAVLPKSHASSMRHTPLLPSSLTPSAAFSYLHSQKCTLSPLLPGLTHSSAVPGAWGPREGEGLGPPVCPASGNEVFLSTDHTQRKGCTYQYSWIQMWWNSMSKSQIIPSLKKKKIIMVMIKLINFQLSFIVIPLLNNSLLTQNTCIVLAFSISVDKKSPFLCQILAFICSRNEKL